MRILVYTTLFPNFVWPDHGVFIKERVLNLARASGHEIRVVAPVPYVPPGLPGWRRAYRRIPDREVIEGLEVRHPRYALIPKVATRIHGGLLAGSTRGAVRRLRGEFPFDVIDAHYVYPDGYAATRIGRALGVPVVVSARGSDVNLFARMDSIRPRLVETCRDAAAVIAVSAALRDALASIGVPPETISVVPNGVDAARFHPMPQRAARARLGLPAGPLLLSVGHLVPNKGMDRLLRAVASIPGGNGSAPFLAIVGGGPEEGALRRLAATLGIEGRVRFAGPVPHAEVPAWYAAADFFCLATEREGWPNAVTEAIACGLPVVATRVGGIPEIVRGPEIGLLANGDEASFAGALREALARPWDREAIARYGATHTWDRTARAAARVLEEAARRGAPHRGSAR